MSNIEFNNYLEMKRFVPDDFSELNSYCKSESLDPTYFMNQLQKRRHRKSVSKLHSILLKIFQKKKTSDNANANLITILIKRDIKKYGKTKHIKKAGQRININLSGHLRIEIY